LQKFYAHSVEGKPTHKWHLLEEHLKNTAELAKSFADVFGAGEWAYPELTQERSNNYGDKTGSIQRKENTENVTE
jgi:hypothetical protein